MSDTILIVEDDRSIAELVAKNLEASGYTCVIQRDGDLALRSYHETHPVLVVLDGMLPGMDGLEILRRLRTEHDTPVLMLTARSAESDKVLGLELGADDYLTKPFSPRELVARVRALLRRAQSEVAHTTLRCGALLIDGARRSVEREGNSVTLTSLEFDLLYFLATHRNKVYSRESLMHQVWGQDRVVDERSIDSLISRLRRKLEPDPGQPRYVQTVWGAGYRFAGESE